MSKSETQEIVTINYDPVLGAQYGTTIVPVQNEMLLLQKQQMYSKVPFLKMRTKVKR